MMTIWTLDCVFSTAMYISDSEETLRYTIGSEMEEVCRLRVDLRHLPVFSMRGMTSRPFYTGTRYPPIQVFDIA